MASAKKKRAESSKSAKSGKVDAAEKKRAKANKIDKAGKPGKPKPADGTPHALGYRMPAEWETHAATWLAWPHNRTDWPGKGLLVQWVFVEMAKHLQWGERIRLIVRDEAEHQRALKAFLAGGVELSRLDVLVQETNRSWTRDSLPTFVVRAHRLQGESPRQHRVEREVAAVKWQFNGWARYPDWELDDAAGELVAERYATRVFRPVTEVDREKKKKKAKGRRVVLEGGAIDVDGQGTLLATEQCLLDGPYPRNAELGKAGTEQVLLEQLGVSKVLWIAEGIAGDDTSGHIDDFARFVAPGVILLGQETNPRDDNYRPLAAARERLEGAKDARGRNVEVIPLPMPSPVYFAGQRLPASYANFYVGNRVVLVPTFNDARDRLALGVLAELFPRRTVVGIHCLDLVLGLGTLHCSTQQEPLAGPRR